MENFECVKTTFQFFKIYIYFLKTNFASHVKRRHQTLDLKKNVDQIHFDCQSLSMFIADDGGHHVCL